MDRSRAVWLFGAILLFVVLANFSAAGALQSNNQSQPDQSSSSSVPSNTTEPDEESPSGAGGVRSRTFLSDFEFWLSAEILLFGFGVIGLEYLILRNTKLTAEEALRVYAVSLIIVGTLFAITAGFDSNQIAPAMGLFGTIAGYLLGRRTPEKSSDEHEKTS